VQNSVKLILQKAGLFKIVKVLNVTMKKAYSYTWSFCDF